VHPPPGWPLFFPFCRFRVLSLFFDRGKVMYFLLPPATPPPWSVNRGVCHPPLFFFCSQAPLLFFVLREGFFFMLFPPGPLKGNHFSPLLFGGGFFFFFAFPRRMQGTEPFQPASPCGECYEPPLFPFFLSRIGWVTPLFPPRYTR